MAVLLNSFLMSFAVWLFSVTRRKLGDRIGYSSLVFYWIGYEFMYLHGEISWTWLNLGNGFANNIRLIQWYEYTGTLGGTLWVLVVNILLYKVLKTILTSKSVHPLSNMALAFLRAMINRPGKNNEGYSAEGQKNLFSDRSIKTNIIVVICLLIIPSIYSLLKFYTYQEKTDPYEMVVIQPNIDPYEKFNDIPPMEQMQILIRLADSLVTPNTEYIVVPETFINNNLWLDRLNENPSISALQEFQAKHPGTKIVVGATTYKIYKTSDEVTATARALDDFFYDSFNTALQVDSTTSIPYYHKSQLVVGVEKMPYPDKLGFLKTLMLNLGGTFRSHGTQNYRDAFPSPDDKCRVAPVICYESIFGEYVTKYVSQAGANFLFVITNDGWWGDTPGYVQHNSFSSLRAIETRRSIARSANTGISSFINQKGEILQRIPWWVQGAIRDTLNANDKITFYVRYGDYIGRAAVFSGVVVIIYLLFYLLRNKLKK